MNPTTKTAGKAGVDLSKLSVKQLKELVDAATTTLETTEAERAQEVRDKLIRMAEEEGFDAATLFKAKRTPRPAKKHYRNPNDKSVVWRGKGKMPGWLRELKDKGQDIEKFAIKPEAAA